MTTCYRTAYGRVVCRRSRWSGYGRWALLGAILGLMALTFLLFACIASRRRRKAGRKPLMGTGWAIRKTNPTTDNPGSNNHGAAEAQTYYNGQQTAPPQQYAYGANANTSPYGAQNSTYPPPQFPPPAHQDGVVR